MKTPEEIKKGLAACSADECHGQHEGCTYQDQFFCTMRMCGDALAYIQRLEERCKTLEYTLLGVMHSVDKWLSVEPYDFDKDDGTVAATRASEAREIALTAIENLQTRIAQLEREMDAAVADLSHSCKYCKIANSDLDESPCRDCFVFESDKNPKRNYFEWRGPCPENTKEADSDGKAESTPNP